MRWAAGVVAASVSAAAAASPYMSRGVIPTEDGVAIEEVVDGLVHPWGVAWLPDGSMLVTERPGRLRVIENGRVLEEPVRRTPQVFAGGQGGMLDVALHPDFENNRYVYLSYTTGDRRNNRTRVGRGVYENGALNDFEVIFENSETKAGGQHFGSRLAWLPDGTLLISVGDGGNPPVSFEGEHIRKQAQMLGTHFGKVVRVRDDGSIPSDNPFARRDDARGEIWTLGHRNIQGLVVDPETGDVWSNEHGALNGDEINKLEKGENYGWPAVTFSRDYRSGTLISDDVAGPEFNEAELVWMDNNAPSGLTIYRGDVFPEWDGDLLSGGLIVREVRRVNLDRSGRVRGETRIDIGSRVRDVRVGPDGAVYVLTDERNGRLLRLTPSE
jgi:glucose/arabinose dehydrogenase